MPNKLKRRPAQLGRVLRSLARQIPERPRAPIFVFQQDMFSDLPRELESDAIVVTKGLHSYGASCEVDQLSIYARKETFRNLGLLIIGSVLKGLPKIVLSLSHPASNVRRIVIEPEWPSRKSNPNGLGVKPMFFAYGMSGATRHPWIHSGIPVHDLPFFNLTNEQNAVYTNEEKEARDTLAGFGSDAASIELARLMLDISQPSCRLDEVELEGEPGFRGVAPCSAEVMLRLPRSFGWEFRWKMPRG